MTAVTAITTTLLLAVTPPSVADQDQQDRQFWAWLSAEARQIDLEQLKPIEAISLLLTVARGCYVMQQEQAADELYQRAMAINKQDAKTSHHFPFFRYATDTGQLDLAEQIAANSKSPTILDQLSLEKFRRGVDNALDGFPHEDMTFYTAYELAGILIEREEYARVEKFVSEVEIPEGNDPEEVAGMAFEKIALRYRDKGDMPNARRYIDKAMAVAGRHFYTGYAIEIEHRSLHGTLLDDLDTFARRGAAHPAHMGRELTCLLVQELVHCGHDAEAKKVIKLLEKQEDRRDAQRLVAKTQARRGDVTAALQTIEQFDETQARNDARLELAEVVSKTGRSETAMRLADFVLRNMAEEVTDDLLPTCRRLSRLYGALRGKEQLEQLLSRTTTATLKKECLRCAVDGFTTAIAK